MKKIALLVLVALGTLAGSVHVTSTVQVEMAAPEMGIYEVLERVAEELGQSFEEKCEGYEDGAVSVEKEEDAYRVAIIESGGIIEVAIEDLL